MARITFDPFPLETRYRAALGTADETAVFARIAAELRDAGADLWGDFDLLAVYGPMEPEERAYRIENIEYAFAGDRAEADFDEARYGYETRTGRDWQDGWSDGWVDRHRDAYLAGRLAA